jgi:hypothetical protein
MCCNDVCSKLLSSATSASSTASLFGLTGCKEALDSTRLITRVGDTSRTKPWSVIRHGSGLARDDEHVQLIKYSLACPENCRLHGQKRRVEAGRRQGRRKTRHEEDKGGRARHLECGKRCNTLAES